MSSWPVSRAVISTSVGPEHGPDEVLGEHQVRSPPWRDADVGDGPLDGDRGVRRQRPRRRRPDQQVGAGPRAVGQREPHVDRGVDVVLVALGHLVVRERRLVARAVGRDAVVLDEQALAVDLLERPPDALDVARGHRQVGLVEVDPVAHALGHRGEGADVLERRLAAGGVELGDAVALDVALGREAELLLHGELHRQPVAVPAGPTRHVVPAHRPEPGEEVLEGAGLDVVGAGRAVRGGRALVEDPGLALGRLLERAAEDVALVPALENLLLDRRQVDAGGQGGEARAHGCPSVWCAGDLPTLQSAARAPTGHVTWADARTRGGCSNPVAGVRYSCRRRRTDRMVTPGDGHGVWCNWQHG